MTDYNYKNKVDNYLFKLFLGIVIFIVGIIILYFKGVLTFHF